jgi:hypothetical protein
MTPRERGDHANRLLEDPVLRQALDSIRDGIVSKIEASPIGDRDTHHEAAISLQLLKRVRSELMQMVSDVKVDEHRTKQDAFIKNMKQSITTR